MVFLGFFFCRSEGQILCLGGSQESLVPNGPSAVSFSVCSEKVLGREVSGSVASVTCLFVTSAVPRTCLRQACVFLQVYPCRSIVTSVFCCVCDHE